MCLTVEIVKFTTKPIVCYKRFRKTGNDKVFKTPYQRFIWNKGQLVTVAGFTMSPFNGSRVEVNQGLHAYTTLARAQRNKDYGEVVMEMLIPQNTRYIKGRNSEIVATSMKMVKEAKKRKNVRVKSKKRTR